MRLIITLLLSTATAVAQDSLTLNFSIGSNQLSLMEKKKWVQTMNKDVKQIVRIIGYTDSLGNTTKNKVLSMERADGVRRLLDSINPDWLRNTTTEGLGEQPTLGIADRKVVVYFSKTLSAKIKKLKVGDHLTLMGLNFEPGTEEYLPGMDRIIDDLFNVMHEIPSLRISIEGHICCDVYDETDLSTRRAKTLYLDLIRRGIDSKRLAFKGLGSTQPKWPLPEKNEQEQSENRRVELRILAL
jgi:outer membrane protein OmpA-like peptidoglycan-associated protein